MSREAPCRRLLLNGTSGTAFFATAMDLDYVIPCATPCGWHVVEGEAFAMAHVGNTNGLPDLRAHFVGRRPSGCLLEIDAWIRSEVKAISPLVDRLMRLVAGSHCVAGEEQAVELALREALTNAVVHGNRMDAHKLVHVRCRCELGKGVSLIVSDQGKGFDPNGLPDPLVAENLEKRDGRGILLMKQSMDEVSFKGHGTEVHMRKTSPRQQKRISDSPGSRLKAGIARPAATDPFHRQER